MEIDIRTESSDVLIRLAGELGGNIPQETYAEVMALARNGRRLIVDLSGLTQISAMGLRALLILFRSVSAFGAEVLPRSVPDELLQVADAAGFSTLFRRSAATARAQLPGSLTPRIDSYPTHAYGRFALRPGFLLPFGATEVPRGVNFSVYSKHATACSLVLFEPGEVVPYAEIPFPPEFRVGDVYAMTVFDLEVENFEYGFRMQGPHRPAEGHRFDSSKVLLDPMARCVSGREMWGIEPDRSYPFRYRARIVPEDFDWEGDRPLGLPIQDLVIYEMHVRGFTRSPSSEVRQPGTFAGLREKIPYLRQLGVNCVELMPIFEFDELENDRVNPRTGERLFNYWGYSTVGFFAPNASYAATATAGMQADEFKATVKDLHRNGIEVILDVVFNHTAEGDERGPTLSFRGLDNRVYYMLTPDGRYYNFSGCGNTLNCNHPVVRDFVLNCLRYWVEAYHIDGFRFDLASILGRDAQGTPLPNPPLVESMAMDPVLANTKLIAEAWDAGGLYQVGTFPAYGRWAEWNGKYRDCIRRFLKGDMGQVREFSSRLVGSPDLYATRGPTATINFVTSHDGFTLADLVSYNVKHNEANGEDNRDGINENYSWNCGAEGETNNPKIRQLRRKQIKNALAMLLLSQGVPMLSMGDEIGRTQLGNNNAYCHDSPLTWLDWSLTEANAGLLRFCQRLIAFRRSHPVLRQSAYPGYRTPDGDLLEVSWHGIYPWQPDWAPHSRTLAAMLSSVTQQVQDTLYVAFNMYWEALDFQLPAPPKKQFWHLVIDTAKNSPHDIVDPGREARLPIGRHVTVEARSTVVLVAKG